MAAHRHWRLYVTATAGGYIGISEIELRNSVGGSDLTGSGTASHSTALGGWESSKAFDNNTGTAWATYPSGPPQWIAYDFGAGVSFDIIEFRITPRTDGFHSEAPSNFLFQYSDDGSAWTTAVSFTGVSWPSAAPQTFSFAPQPQRSTQAVVEVVIYPAASGRLSQSVVEVVVEPGQGIRVTQDAVEVIVGSGQGTRVTQDAVEVLVGSGQGVRVTQDAAEVVIGIPKGALVTQDAVEVVLRDTGVQAAGVRLSQEVLETAQYPDSNLRLTQEVLEVAQEQIVPVRLTQEALEYANEPLNNIATSQVCLEVLLAGEFLPVAPKRNHSFIKVYMATGHKANASFNG